MSAHIDISLLRIIKYREKFDKVAKYIPKDSVDKRTRAIVKDIKKYFESTEEDKIHFSSFRSLFFTQYHKNLKEEDVKFYNLILKKMEADVPEAVEKNIVNNLLELGFATKAANHIDDYQAGEEIDIVTVMHELSALTREKLQRATSFEFATVDESSIEEGLSDDEGLRYPLKCLNETYRRVQPGDATIVAARPGCGKTTFLCNLNAAFVEDMEDHEVILWFNNESRRQKIMSRQIQATLGKTDAELVAMQKAKTLTPAYVKAMGRPDRVRVYDIHGKDTNYVEDIIESVGSKNVRVMIFDMIDKITFHNLADGMREDQRLEAMYTWSRELGVIHEASTFPSSQVSVEGAGLLHPLEHMLKDSKTGKQGACDGILMIGKSDDPMLARTRGISMPKTKQRRAGQSDLMGEVLFDEDRGRYVES